jgi:hypothetical protein
MLKPHCKRLKIIAGNDAPDGLKIVRIPCKKWDCSICGPKNAQLWRTYLLKRLSKPDMIGKKWCFLTITLPSKYHNAQASRDGVTALQKAWDRLYMPLQRLIGRKLSYVYFYEGHSTKKDASGIEYTAYHRHCIIDIGEEYDKDPLIYVWLRPQYHHPIQAWLKERLVKYGAGYILDLRRIRDVGYGSSIGAVLYATKYMSKGSRWDDFKKGARRVGVSTDIGSPKRKQSSENWNVMFGLSRENWQKRFGNVENVTTHEFLLGKDFDASGFFPPIFEDD